MRMSGNAFANDEHTGQFLAPSDELVFAAASGANPLLSSTASFLDNTNNDLRSVTRAPSAVLVYSGRRRACRSRGALCSAWLPDAGAVAESVVPGHISFQASSDALQLNELRAQQPQQQSQQQSQQQQRQQQPQPQPQQQLFQQSFSAATSFAGASVNASARSFFAAAAVRANVAVAVDANTAQAQSSDRMNTDDDDSTNNNRVVSRTVIGAAPRLPTTAASSSSSSSSSRIATSSRPLAALALPDDLADLVDARALSANAAALRACCDIMQVQRSLHRRNRRFLNQETHIRMYLFECVSCCCFFCRGSGCLA